MTIPLIKSAQPVGPNVRAADRRFTKLHMKTLKSELAQRRLEIQQAKLGRQLRAQESQLRRLRA